MGLFGEQHARYSIEHASPKRLGGLLKSYYRQAA
jgi:hypothetical protein